MKQTRREFLVSASTVGAGLTLTGMGMAKQAVPGKKTFGIKVYATRWGYQGSMDDFCKHVKSEGYDGVEDCLPGDKSQEEALFEALDKYNLSFAALAGSGGASFSDHKESYERNLQRAISKKPDFINCHAGREFFSFEQNKELILLAIELSTQTSIPIYQETHRGRMLFAAHVCKPFLDNISDLRLTLDVSHWCAVAESLLGNQQKTITEALNRTDHVHARIGHEEGAQVPEPRAPEWQKAKDAHYEWWDKVVALKKAKGETLTVTPEFGPANYMWTTPYTRQPLANQWEINAHMMNEWRKRYL